MLQTVHFLPAIERQSVNIQNYQQLLTNCCHLQYCLVNLQKLMPALGFLSLKLAEERYLGQRVFLLIYTF